MEDEQMISGSRGDRTLSPGFRRRDLRARREEARRVFGVADADWEGITASPLLMDIADVMVESAIGCVPVPLGIADGFLVDGRDVAVPLAVEEPSVIAAASYAARLVRRGGGFTTWAEQPVMTAQVFLENVTEDGGKRIATQEAKVRSLLAAELASLERRGGGFRGMGVERLPSGTIRVDLKVDVRDSLGANRLNTAAEAVRPLLEEVSGGRALMAVLTNAARDRIAGARYALPVDGLGARLPAGMSAAEAGRRIAAASSVAQEDPSRAVTHNKGIMNGIGALALATMNDTRSVEAAAHAWACRDGTCRGLATHRVENGILHGELSLPLPLATAGGSVDFHPAARACLGIMGNPDGPGLARIAAALGLAQNLAALLALVTHGIQAGHMRLSAARLAWRAGARGAEARRVADLLSDASHADQAAARDALARLRRGAP
jgi:hydroxymethylglutaryl-CoA reductase